MFFVTANDGKFREAVKLIPGLKQAKLDVPEIQADSLEEVARFSIAFAYEQLGEPCFVEDAGIFINALKGFPGVYSHYVYDTITPEGILKQMEGVEDRSAYFESCIAYHDGKEVHVFKGKIKGTIAHEIRGSEGFAFDPIFVPLGREKTFGEDFDYKEKLGHRTRSLRALVEFLGKPL